MRLRGSCEWALVLYAKKRDEDLARNVATKRFHPRLTQILVLLARAVLEGTHLFQTGTRTDDVRMLRDHLAQDFDCG